MKRLLAVAIAAILTLSGCGAESPPHKPIVAPVESDLPVAEDPPSAPSQVPGEDVPEKVITLRMAGFPLSFIPDHIPDDNGYVMYQNMYNRLCKLDASKSAPIPDLAESWEYSDDVMTLTFHLKKNARWHDGLPVTSADVKYTFDTIKADPSCYFSPQTSIISSIGAPDDYTVVFNLNAPDASFATMLGWYGTFILPKHILDVGISWAENTGADTLAIGSGPFKLSEYKPGESVTLVKNEDYHDGAPKLDRLVFTVIPDIADAVTALINGEIDSMEGVPPGKVPELMTNPDLVVFLNDFPSPFRVVFNMDDPITGDLAVRKAIALATDREEISQKAYAGQFHPEYNMYPSNVAWASNGKDTCPKTPDYDAASRLLESAGYTRDEEGFFVSIGVNYFASLFGCDTLVEVWKSQLENAGIRLIPSPVEYQEWALKMDSGDFQMEIQDGFMGPDPVALKNRLFTDASGNYGGYSNLEFDELMLLGSATADIDERAAVYKEAQRILAEELPYMPFVCYSSPEAYWRNLSDMPIDGTGKWGWAEYTYTDVNRR